MKTMIRRPLLLSCLAFAGLAWMGQAQAIPAFAKQYEKDCSSCHNAWPQLNAEGRAFKENGYRQADEVGQDVDVEDYVAFNVVARPYDKQGTADNPRLRVFHELEVFISGPIGDSFSGFAEIEYEDEIDNFEGSLLATAALTYHIIPEFNIQGVWGEALFADPYTSFVKDAGKLTRGSVQLNNRSFGGTDGALLSARQGISATGRIAERLFYVVGINGLADDAFGDDASNVHARVAFDITPDIMVGAFHIQGDNTSLNREYTRSGIDFLVDIGGSRITGGWATGDDDICATTDCTGAAPGSFSEVSNDVLSLQWYHTFQTSTGRPTVVPLIRYDSYETGNGVNQFDELIFNLGFYFRENAKVYVEYFDQIDVPAGVVANDRLTLQAAVGF